MSPYREIQVAFDRIQEICRHWINATVRFMIFGGSLDIYVKGSFFLPRLMWAKGMYRDFKRICRGYVGSCGDCSG